MRRLANTVCGAALVLLAMASASVTAKASDLEGIALKSAWSRATPPGAQVAAGYLTLQNTTASAVTLTGGTADFAQIEIHEMEMKDGMMRMTPLAGGLTVAPGETVTLEPGGLHIMFMGLTEPFAEGETREATLDFGEMGTLDVSFRVAPLGAMAYPTGD